MNRIYKTITTNTAVAVFSEIIPSPSHRSRFGAHIVFGKTESHAISVLESLVTIDLQVHRQTISMEDANA
ncbi:MAG: hypothetical protein GC179_08360 [Anaerolineaceae bacterium]|nr:hypothetical protein [Anaerolineaceae bacterium]